MTYENILHFASPVADKTARSELEKRKASLVREMHTTRAMAAEWFFPETFLPGSEFGFRIWGCTVKGVADFDSTSMSVSMTSPISCSSLRKTFYMHPSFFRRQAYGNRLMTGGEPTPYAVEAAKNLLSGLYADYMHMEEYKDAIPEELDRMELDLQQKLAAWKEKTAPLRELYIELCKQSGELKSRFRNKEMRQEEYISLKEPIHNEIVSLLKRQVFHYSTPAFFLPIIREMGNISDVWSTLVYNYCSDTRPTNQT